jgi:hypothetical protein
LKFELAARCFVPAIIDPFRKKPGGAAEGVDTSDEIVAPIRRFEVAS